MSDIYNYQENLHKIQSLVIERISHFKYSKQAKIPYKVHSLVESMNCRIIDFCESIDLLIKTNHIVPAILLIRSIIEVTAIIYRISYSVDKSIENNKLIVDFDDLIMNLNFGTRYGSDYKAINIITHIDKLNKKYNVISNFYNDLSEFVHPNWDGVQGSYTELNEDEINTLIIRVITTENPVFNWIEGCYNLCMEIYLEEVNKLMLDLPEFAKICESEIKNKINTLYPFDI